MTHLRNAAHEQPINRPDYTLKLTRITYPASELLPAGVHYGHSGFLHTVGWKAHKGAGIQPLPQWIPRHCSMTLKLLRGLPAAAACIAAASMVLSDWPSPHPCGPRILSSKKWIFADCACM